jgi:hypothetical protein
MPPNADALLRDIGIAKVCKTAAEYRAAREKAEAASIHDAREAKHAAWKADGCPGSKYTCKLCDRIEACPEDMVFHGNAAHGIQWSPDECEVSLKYGPTARIISGPEFFEAHLAKLRRM